LCQDVLERCFISLLSQDDLDLLLVSFRVMGFSLITVYVEMSIINIT